MKALLLDPGQPRTLYPLTVEYNLLDLPVGGVTFRAVQIRRLAEANFEQAEPQDDVLTIRGDAWLSLETLARLRSAEGACRVVDSAGVVFAERGPDGEPPEAVPTLEASSEDFLVTYPWDLLRINEELAGRIRENHFEGKIHEGVHVTGRLQLGRGSEILPGVFMEGTIIIGEECRIGPNCYLRGSTAIGSHCRIGQAVEIKNSIIGSRTNVGHLSYCGDSVVGDSVNFGAGTIVANLRHDGANHRSSVEGELIDTGRRKFGAVIANGVHTGIHTSIYPGRKLWPHTSTRPGEIVDRDRIT